MIRHFRLSGIKDVLTAAVRTHHRAATPQVQKYPRVAQRPVAAIAGDTTLIHQNSINKRNDILSVLHSCLLAEWPR